MTGLFLFQVLFLTCRFGSTTTPWLCDSDGRDRLDPWNTAPLSGNCQHRELIVLETPDSAEDAALEAQQMLLETSLDLVFAAADAAGKDGIVDPVVILLDCEDSIGSEIACSWLGSEAVADAIAERRAADVADREDADKTTVYAQAFTQRECQEVVPKIFPYLAPVFLQKPSDEGFLAIAVTSGGASALTVPHSARP